MKKSCTLFILSLLFNYLLVASDNQHQKIPKTYKSPLMVVLMVKNEEPVMLKTLQPLVDGGINTFFIFDTGSTDKTIEITQQFFDDFRYSKKVHIGI